MDFLKLVLARDKSGAISVVTQKETAQYFGWDEAFEQWPHHHVWHPDGRWVMSYRKVYMDPRYPGGCRLRICRSTRKKGYPGGMTHCFRMQGGWSRKHLVQLAAVAGDKFEWMENTRYKRVDRSDWLKLVR